MQWCMHGPSYLAATAADTCQEQAPKSTGFVEGQETALLYQGLSMGHIGQQRGPKYQNVSETKRSLHLE